MIGRFIRRLHHLAARRRFEQELDEELRIHFEMKVEQAVASGVPLEEARRRARREMGNLTRAREQARSAWGWDWWDGLRQDLRFASRSLRRQPGFACAAVATLILGIGANATVFSLARAVVLDGLALDRPDEVYAVGDPQTLATEWGTWDTDGYERSADLLSLPMFRTLRHEQQVFGNLAAFSSFTRRGYWRVAGGDGPRDVGTLRLVSGNFFEMLGLEASRGRNLADEDDAPGAPLAVVVSERFWRRKLHQVPDVVGRQLEVNDRVLTVIGVAAAGFDGVHVDQTIDFWMPLSAHANLLGLEDRSSSPNVMWLRAAGRRSGGIDEGVTEQATARFRDAVRAEGNLSEDEAERLDRTVLTLSPLARGLSRSRHDLERPLELLASVAVLVLLMACANVANLQLARARRREREIAARLALGASRRRVIGQLLTESSILALLGAAGGLALATWGGKILVRLLIASDSVLADRTDLDVRLLAFALLTAGITVLLFGLVPALRATGRPLVPSLRDGGLGRPTRPRVAPGSALVVIQVALSLVLILAAGLMLRTLHQLRGIDPGFIGDSVVIVEIDPQAGGSDGADPTRLERLYEGVLERIGSLPGVNAASASLYPMLSGRGWTTSLHAADSAVDPEERNVRILTVRGTHFETFQIPLLTGEAIDGSEGAEGARQVAVVNEVMARHFWGMTDVVGRRFGFEPEDPHEIEIVGVVSDHRFDGVRDDIAPMIYLPFAQVQTPLQSIEARITGMDPEAALGAVRRAIGAAEPQLPIVRAQAVPQILEEQLAEARALTRLLTVFGLVALVLVAIGLYGVLSYGVTERAREIGIRLALGARRGHVEGFILRRALGLVAVGCVLGVGCALALARMIRSLLYDLEPHDPTTLVATLAVVGAVGLAASWLPARRAARVDPQRVLRAD